MKLVDRTLTAFLEELASAAPAPGGGSAAALAGACAAALCVMAARLTLGRESCRASWPEAQRALADARELEGKLRDLVDEDAAAYQAVVAARALPRGTDPEKAARKNAIQAATKAAAEVPLRTLELIAACVDAAEALVMRGNPSCITDAGTAGELCRAGAAAAEWNVRVNLPTLADGSVRDGLEVRARTALAEVEAAADRIAHALDESLSKGGRT